MSWEDTKCPCGGKKERETMLCGECCKAFSSTIEYAAVANTSLGFNVRRSCAIKLLGYARKRKSRFFKEAA